MRLRDKLPEFDGATRWLNSRPLQKQDLLGDHPILIHFWSISCESCKQDIAKVNALRDEYEGRLNIIAIHTPRSKEDESVRQIEALAKQLDITQPICIDNDYKLSDVFKNTYVPTYYVFDAHGLLKHKQTSGRVRQLRQRINRLLRLN